MHGYDVVVRDLRRGVCRCGDDKRPGHPFCRGCFWKLPEAYQSRAYRLVDFRSALSIAAMRLIYWRCLVQLGFVDVERKVG